MLMCFFSSTRTRRTSLFLAVICAVLSCFVQPGNVFAACFNNALMQGQDPSVVLKDGLFHLVQSDGRRIHLRRSATIGGLATASNPVIYTPPAYSELWAPEFHWISNRWYLYYTMNTNAAAGGRHRRGFVAESQGADPAGPYTLHGIIFHDYWNIDGNVFSWNNRLYYTFSGEPVVGAQNIYIAPMSNPYTLSGPPVRISAPVESWERVGNPDVNEGSWGFQRGGQLYVVYSASGCWTDDYKLGLLTLTGSDPLNPSAWTKTGPVFSQAPGAYGPGHNSLAQDVAGQWWNFYHANTNSGEGCGGKRRIRAQRVFWKNNGEPDFGSPVPHGSTINDSPDFLTAHLALLETSGTLASMSVCGRVGTVRGAIQWARPGLHFDGASTWVDCGPSVGNDVQHQITLSAWVRPESFTDWAGIITKGTNVSPYALQLWNDGSVRFTANWSSPHGSIGSGSWNSQRKLTLGQWHHVAVTYDGERVRFYIDRVLDANQPLVSLRFGVAYEPLVIGADLPGADEFFHGTIRGARVYGRPLSLAEIMATENFPPTLGAYTNVEVTAASTYSVPAFASDPNPSQTLTFTLLSAPAGATINPATGLFNWRPAVDQAPSTNLVILTVTDNGSPSLSATQSFTITVRSPSVPVMSAPEVRGDELSIQVEGEEGVEYAVVTSTNMLDWNLLYTTNPVYLPFSVSLPLTTNAPQAFFRIEHR